MLSIQIGRNGSSGFASPKPLYAQVRDLMLSRVRGGEWGAGDTLPNEFALASSFEVSIGTVRRAVTELEAIGVLVRKQGRGTFVAGRGTAALKERFTRLRGEGGERLMPDYTLVSLVRREPNAMERQQLGSAVRQGVVEVIQIVAMDGTAIGVEASALPAALFPRIETQLQFGQHLYPLLADYGALVTRIEETIALEPAGDGIAAHLATEPGRPLLAVARRAIALDDMAVEWRIAHYLPAFVRYAGGG